LSSQFFHRIFDFIFDKILFLFKMWRSAKIKKVKECKPGSGGCGGCSGFGYFLGFVGAAIYYISTANGFWMGVLGVLKAIVWPAILIFEVMKFLGV